MDIVKIALKWLKPSLIFLLNLLTFHLFPNFIKISLTCLYLILIMAYIAFPEQLYHADVG